MRAQRCMHRRPLRLHVHYLMRPILVPMARIERATSPLPRECSATELHGPCESENALPTETGGAGEGNRTLVVSLEGFCSTIELHPPVSALALTDARRLPMSQNWWRGKDSNLRRLSQQIYSLPPLTAREPLRGNRALSGNYPLLSNVIGLFSARAAALKRRTRQAGRSHLTNCLCS